MNETVKTSAFVAVALVVAVVAWVSRPRLPAPGELAALPEQLFPQFDDPLQATSLKIVRFDELTATLRPFEVAQQEGKWSIPSHHFYPADAEKQLAQVAASFIGLKPLDVAGDSPGDHGLFGVVDPDPQRLKVGDTGVGTRVEIKRDKDVLLSLIVGKAVPDQAELRYVRVPGRDPVYTVKLKTDKLSTKFEDWIEDDLLKLNTWDVKQVAINDYSVDILQGLLDPRSRITLEYDDGKSEWKLVENLSFDREKEDWVDLKLADDEELNTSKLNDMKWALDDLKIVDVRPKPEGLSANLKETGPLKLDGRAVQSLQNRGFYLHRNQLLSSEGEVNVLMKDGVQYVLRFGQIATGLEDEDGEEKKPGPGEKEEEAERAKSGGVNRYLFVMAELDRDAIPKPELEPLPGEKKPEGAAGSDRPEEEASGGNGAAGEAAQPAAGAEPAPEAADSAEPSPPPAAEDAPADDKPGPKPEGEQEASDEPGPKAAEAEVEKEEPEVGAEAERQRIEKENKRKQDEYDEKIKKAQERVQELNQRFADWYYVISDDVYRKIHLGRDDVIKKKEKDDDKDEEAGDVESAETRDAEQAQPETDQSGVSAFEMLKEEGLEEKEE